jgi:hypothetical protein
LTLNEKTKVMKKYLVVFALTAVVAACNNASDSTAEAKDSLDSIAAEGKEAIDSSAEARKDAIDSTTEQKKEAIDPRDSLNRADTANNE